MKIQAKNLFSFILFSLFFSAPVFSQDEAPLSDNFSLEAALELFKNAESPEDFEKRLNKEDSQVTNLDLDGNGETDYIRVEDITEGEVHALVLQVDVNEKESQDIAIIEIEKTGKEEAVLQIVGDEDIFGADHFVEPYELEANGNGRGPSVSVARIVVNVWGWPSVRFVYGPRYRPWVSPFRYRNYPRWWRPWRPVPVRTFVTYRAPLRVHYRVATTHRAVRAHKVYTPRRRTSTVVRTRTTTRKAVNPSRKGVQRTTTTKTITGPRGGQVQKKTTTTTVKGKRGKTAKKRTTTTRKRGN